MAWYNSATQVKQGHNVYPYEDHTRSHPQAFIVDGGQRKNSIMSYPTPDGSNNYVVKTERVVEVVRPVVTRRVLVNGEPVKEERIVGAAYENDNKALKENFHNLGKVKDFFNQVQMEASMPPVDPILTHPGTKHNWHAPQNDRPNWGRRAAWTSRDDSPTSRYPQHFEVTHHNTSRNGSPPRYNQQHPRFSQPSSGTNKPNWPSRSHSPIMVHSEVITYPSSVTRPNRLDDSPSRPMVRPNSGTRRPNWPSNPNNSSSTSMMHPELTHQNSGTRPPIRPNDLDNYSSRSIVHPELSHQNSSNWPSQNNNPPHWQNTRDDSPPNFITHPNSGTSRPRWPSNRDYSPPRSMPRSGLTNPSSSTRSNWLSNRDGSPPPSIASLEPSIRPYQTSTQDDSPPRSMPRHGLSNPTSGTKSNWFSRPDDSPPPSSNWKSNQDDSPPRSMAHLGQRNQNSGTKSNWLSTRDDSPLSSGIRPNRTSRQDDSPPKSMMQSKLSHPKSNTRPNWFAQDDSPKYDDENGEEQRNTSPLHNQLERVNILDNQGPDTKLSKMNADNARSESNIKPTSYDGTTIDDPAGLSNPSSGLVKTGNSNSPNKENSQQIKESDVKPKWPTRKGQDVSGNNMGPTPSMIGDEDDIPSLNNPKSETFEGTTPKVEESYYKKPSNKWQGKPLSMEDGTNKVDKPNFNGGWYKQPNRPLTSATSNVDHLMSVLEEAKKTGAYPIAPEMQNSTTMPHWSAISPNPPQGLHSSTTPQWNEITPNSNLAHTIIDSTEAKRRYGYSSHPTTYFAPTTGYFGTLSSEDAVKKYGGTFLPEQKYLKSNNQR